MVERMRFLAGLVTKCTNIVVDSPLVLVVDNVRVERKIGFAKEVAQCLVNVLSACPIGNTMNVDLATRFSVAHGRGNSFQVIESGLDDNVLDILLDIGQLACISKCLDIGHHCIFMVGVEEVKDGLADYLS